MRLAVFTNQFPSRLTTFFARDMRALQEAGVEIDIFPIYPLDASLWGCVPGILNEKVLPRDRVHHIRLSGGLRLRAWSALRGLPSFIRDSAVIASSALRYGIGPVAKTVYASLKAWAWAQQYSAGDYDHILAYWGNYVASCAYLFHRLTDSRVPFSMFVRARADLYQNPVYLARKMLYADNIFLVCEFNRRYIQQRYPSIFPQLAGKMRVHYGGLDLNQVQFAPDEREPRKLLAVGRFEELKGFRHLLRAVSAVHRRGLLVDLDFIGGGEQERDLRALADELGLTRHVTFRGWLLPDDVLRAMRQATVLVHAPVALDAMPNVIKEAMAVGTPVIASDLAGIPELVDDGRCGVLVPPRDIEALASAIETLLTDESLRGRYARAARLHVERHFDVWRNGRRLADRLRGTERRMG